MDISLSIVGRLVLLIDKSVLASSQAGREGCIVVLGDRLVGFLGCLGAGALDGL